MLYATYTFAGENNQLAAASKSCADLNNLCDATTGCVTTDAEADGGGIDAGRLDGSSDESGKDGVLESIKLYDMGSARLHFKQHPDAALGLLMVRSDELRVDLKRSSYHYHPTQVVITTTSTSDVVGVSIASAAADSFGAKFEERLRTSMMVSSLAGTQHRLFVESDLWSHYQGKFGSFSSVLRSVLLEQAAALLVRPFAITEDDAEGNTTPLVALVDCLTAHYSKIPSSGGPEDDSGGSMPKTESAKSKKKRRWFWGGLGALARLRKPTEDPSPAGGSGGEKAASAAGAGVDRPTGARGGVLSSDGVATIRSIDLTSIAAELWDASTVFRAVLGAAPLQSTDTAVTGKDESLSMWEGPSAATDGPMPCCIADCTPETVRVLGGAAASDATMAIAWVRDASIAVMAVLPPDAIVDDMQLEAWLARSQPNFTQAAQLVRAVWTSWSAVLRGSKT